MLPGSDHRAQPCHRQRGGRPIPRGALVSRRNRPGGLFHTGTLSERRDGLSAAGRARRPAWGTRAQLQADQDWRTGPGGRLGRPRVGSGRERDRRIARWWWLRPTHRTRPPAREARRRRRLCFVAARDRRLRRRLLRGWRGGCCCHEAQAPHAHCRGACRSARTSAEGRSHRSRSSSAIDRQRHASSFRAATTGFEWGHDPNGGSIDEQLSIKAQVPEVDSHRSWRR